MRPPEERRRYLRIPLGWRAVVEGPNDARVVEVVDISLNGALLATAEADPAWPGEGLYRLRIELSADIGIEMHLRPVHRDGARAGFCCHHMELDSLAHLRRLLELHSGDPQRIYRELAELRP